MHQSFGGDACPYQVCFYNLDSAAHKTRLISADSYSPYSHAFGIYSTNSIGSVFHENLVNGTSGAEGFKGYGIRITSGGGNTMTGNYILDAGPGTDAVAIQTPENGGWCYDNQLRAAVWTIGCDASLGNY